MTPDYFPLVAGAMREYSSANARGKGTFQTLVLSVTTVGAVTTAKCRRTIYWNGEPPKVVENG